MTLEQWFIFFLAVQVIHFAGTWKLYHIAGRKPWEAAIPIYNAVILMRIINRPWWWVILLFIPIVNLIMFPVVWVETLRSFGRTSTTDTLLGIFTLGFYIYYINYTQKLNYRPERDLKPTGKGGDFVSSVLFAVVVATIVHTYVMQPFQIPTSSLEKTLMVGDFLFVSKFHYGARTPMTTVAVPMFHDTVPVINTRSYSKWPQLPYFRLPGLEKVKKNDIVVFNWPADTVTKFFDRSAVGLRKPIDKKSNYVKRCVGTPGDMLSIKDGYVYINGKKLQLSERARPQYSYSVITDGSSMNPDYLRKNLDITDPFGQVSATEYRFASLTAENAEILKKSPGVVSVTRLVVDQPDNSVFPYTKNWNADNMGPFLIPGKGATIPLTLESLPLYKKIIREYEHNELDVKNGQILINGKPATSYTFQQDYYWMMGDNRHRSEDSRFWGFVPEDHIVGKPVFVWLSYDNVNGRIRWERMFTTVGGDGEPVSYLKPVLAIIAALLIFDYFRKKKKKTA